MHVCLIYRRVSVSCLQRACRTDRCFLLQRQPVATGLACFGALSSCIMFPSSRGQSDRSGGGRGSFYLFFPHFFLWPDHMKSTWRLLSAAGKNDMFLCWASYYGGWKASNMSLYLAFWQYLICKFGYLYICFLVHGCHSNPKCLI